MRKAIAFAMVAVVGLPACGETEEASESEDIRPTAASTEEQTEHDTMVSCDADPTVAAPSAYAPPPGQEAPCADALPAYDEESVAEALARLSPNERYVCQGAALLAAGMGCQAARLACATTTAITVGGTVIPCALVMAMACAGLPASAAVYITRFCMH
jgi:hypothetical protein